QLHDWLGVQRGRWVARRHAERSAPVARRPVVTGELPAECPVSTRFDPFGVSHHEDQAAAQADGGPVFFSEVLGCYVVTRHADIRQIYADVESFSSQKFADPVTPLCPAALAKLGEYGFTKLSGIASLDE